MGKPRNLYEVLLGGGEERKRQGSKRRLGAKRPKTTRHKGRKGNGLGDQVVNFSLTWNSILVFGLVLIVSLAGMYGIGRVHGKAGADPKSLEISSGKVLPPLKASEAKPKSVIKRPVTKEKAPSKPAKRVGNAIPAICIVTYGSDSKARERAGMMVAWLRKRGFPGALVGSLGKRYVVALPMRDLSLKEWKKRLSSLPSPGFASKFRFSRQVKEMYQVNLPAQRNRK